MKTEPETNLEAKGAMVQKRSALRIFACVCGGLLIYVFSFSPVSLLFIKMTGDVPAGLFVLYKPVFWLHENVKFLREVLEAWKDLFS